MGECKRRSSRTCELKPLRPCQRNAYCGRCPKAALPNSRPTLQLSAARRSPMIFPSTTPPIPPPTKSPRATLRSQGNRASRAAVTSPYPVPTAAKDRCADQRPTNRRTFHCSRGSAGNLPILAKVSFRLLAFRRFLSTLLHQPILDWSLRFVWRCFD